MALRVYRSGTKESAGFDRFSEICINCAIIEKDKGHYIELESYLSMELTTNDSCQICHSDFCVDTRKKVNKFQINKLLND